MSYVELINAMRHAQDYPRLWAENKALREALERIRQWDMLDHAADGPYWKAVIDKALGK